MRIGTWWPASCVSIQISRVKKKKCELVTNSFCAGKRGVICHIEPIRVEKKKKTRFLFVQISGAMTSAVSSIEDLVVLSTWLCMPSVPLTASPLSLLFLRHVDKLLTMNKQIVMGSVTNKH